MSTVFENGPAALPPDQQQARAVQQPQAEGTAVQRKAPLSPRALWDTREAQESVGRKAKDSRARFTTLQEAVDHCKVLLETQVQRAIEERAPMNAPINGDASARKAVMTLLPDQFVRELFLHVTRSKDAWPRIRSLFGAPPFNFLRPEDASLFRASGIASHRANMSYERSNETASYNQFGSGHLVDSFDREYRVVYAKAPNPADPLPFDVESMPGTAPIFLNVRVPKRSRGEKQGIFKQSERRAAVMFPRVGETLSVSYSPGLRSLWGVRDSKRTVATIVVKSLAPKSATASTAALIANKV